MAHRGSVRMDQAIQKRLDAARDSGDPEHIKREIQFANESYAMGTGATVGATVGTYICPGLGTIIGGIVGGFFGHKIAEE